MKKPTIAIAHQTITDADAVGNDIMGMYHILKNHGYETSLISEYFSDNIRDLQMNTGNIHNFIENENSILIYHHSIFWEFGEKLLEKFKGNLIFKFHNITPPHFFKDYSQSDYQKCAQGIEQTKKFVTYYNDDPWWVDSTFNSVQLQQTGVKKDRITVVPPFNRLDVLEKIEPNFKIIEGLIKNESNNVLFIGRVAPNKGHIHLINIIKTYKENYNSNINLWILGPIDHNPHNSYYPQLSVLIKKIGLENNISFLDKLPEMDVKAYYLGCDAFLCMSEHEGFCLPIIEAQRLLLPVVTYGGSALRETTGENQIILDAMDYSLAASALFTLYNNENVRNFCKKYGRINVDSRFSSEKNCTKFFSAFELCMNGAS